MSHNLEIKNGVASFFSNQQAAWHNLGHTVDGALTWEQAIEKAGLDFTVAKRNLLNPFTNEAISDVFGVFRDDNQEMLGVVGSRYEPIQNEFMFSFVDAVLDADGEAHYETAGVLGKGEKVFMVANLSQEYDILGTGDKHRSYLAGVGSHDGSTSLRFFVTDVRIVCSNTLQLAIRKAKGKGVSVRHTRDAEARINSKLETLSDARQTFTNTMEKLEILAQRSVDTKMVEEVIAEVFKVDSYDDASTRAKTQMDTVRMLFEQNDNNAFPQFRGTAYNLLNGLTEFTDHYKEVRRTDGRLELTETQMRSENAMFGKASSDKAIMLDLILEKTANAKSVNSSISYSMPILNNIIDNLS